MTAEVSVREADKVLNLTVSPVMMVLSIVGNFLAFLVMCRRSFSGITMSVYLRFLTVMDAGTVVTGLLPRFVLALTDYDFRGRDKLSCQCQVYIVYVFTELSAWTLVIVTLERVLSITKPHRVKILCTKVKSYAILAIACLVILSANSPIFLYFGKQTDAEQHTATDNASLKNESNNLTSSNKTSTVSHLCGFIDNAASSSAHAWFLTHFIKQSLLPFIFIFSFNIVIIIGLIRRKSVLLKSCADGFGNRAQKTVRSADAHLAAMSRKDTSLSITLVVINMVFLICNFPIGIYQQIFFSLPDGQENSDQSLIYSVLVFVLYLNNTLNFILYLVTGSRFRRELRHMFACQKMYA